MGGPTFAHLGPISEQSLSLPLQAARALAISIRIQVLLVGQFSLITFHTMWSECFRHASTWSSRQISGCLFVLIHGLSITLPGCAWLCAFKRGFLSRAPRRR